MFSVNFEFDDVCISSVEKGDLVELYKWIKKNGVYSDRENNIEFNEFCDRFLEYYLGEGEIFLKICISDELVGIVKGRIEFKSSNEFWIWYFGLNNEFRNDNMDSKILKEFMDYFVTYGIDVFYVVVSSEEKKHLSFWNKNGFILTRVCDNLVNSREREKTFILLNNKRNI